ncbi:hypothetical protein D3C72_2481870 [compost metagenome]
MLRMGIDQDGCDHVVARVGLVGDQLIGVIRFEERVRPAFTPNVVVWVDDGEFRVQCRFGFDILPVR